MNASCLILRLRFSLSSALFLAILLSGISVSAFAQSRLPATPDTAIRLVQANQVLVEDWRGKRFERARASLRSRGLKVFISWINTWNRNRANRVSTQRPLNERVRRGSSVYLTVYGYGGATHVRVPQLFGMNLLQVRSVLSPLGLRVRRVTPADFARTCDRNRVGRIFGQAPAPGTRVRRGSSVQISLYLPQGRGNITVPRVSGWDITTALNFLRERCLDVTGIDLNRTRNAILHGAVVDTRPAGGRQAAPRSRITVRIHIKRVGQGRRGTITVPDLRHTDLTSALNHLRITYLTTRSIRFVEIQDGLLHGRVQWQDPGGREKVPPGSQVDLRIFRKGF